MLRDGRWIPTFPNAKYLFSRSEDEYGDPRRNPVAAADPQRNNAYRDSVLPVIAAGQAVLIDGSHAIDDTMASSPPPATPGPCHPQAARWGSARCSAATPCIIRCKLRPALGFALLRAARSGPPHPSPGAGALCRARSLALPRAFRRPPRRRDRYAPPMPSRCISCDIPLPLVEELMARTCSRPNARPSLLDAHHARGRAVHAGEPQRQRRQLKRPPIRPRLVRSWIIGMPALSQRLWLAPRSAG